MLSRRHGVRHPHAERVLHEALFSILAWSERPLHMPSKRAFVAFLVNLAGHVLPVHLQLKMSAG